MKKYQVRIERNARKSFKKLDDYQAKIILSWIKKNLVNTTSPRKKGKQLRGNKKDLWRYRVGDYRIICKIDDEKITILILEVGHRRKIYQVK